jgi:hypothetical protein
MAAHAQGISSPCAIVVASDGKTAYVAQADLKKIAVVDLEKGAVARSIALPAEPNGLALSADGATLYATVGALKGALVVLNAATGEAAATIPIGHTPMAPVLSPDAKTLYVCARFNNRVAVVDLAAGKVSQTVDVLREPVAASLTPDGKTLVVANHLPVGAADGDYIAASVSLIDTATQQVAKNINLPNGCSSLRGVALSPDGAYAYVTHLLGRYQLPTTQLERGWMNTNAVSIIDLAKQSLLNTVLLDDVDLGAANPWGVGCSADGKWLCVAHAGTHEISVIDRNALHEKLAKVAAGEKVSEVSTSPEEVPNDLSFLVGLRRRVALTGNGPRALAMLGAKAIVADYFSDTLESLDAADAKAHPAAIVLEPPRTTPVERRGEMLFNDAAMCFQHWQSCASCHPDTRADGLNWDLLNDGLGNPKNTKSLIFSTATPPAMAHGVRDTAEAAVRSGMKYILFVERPEEDAQAIDQFLRTVMPVRSPYSTGGGLSPAIMRGMKVFEKAQCASCHSGDYLTDLKSYDIGTGKGMDKDTSFDTPTLREVWRTAPYLHDGRAATVKDVLTKFNPGDKHGVTSNLSEEELNDLVEYVLSR